METSIHVLEKQWNELDLSQPPKLHILLKHTIAQVHLFGGIADLVEDFVEKSHQLGKKLDHLTASMGNQGYQKKELSKIRRRWMMMNPLVQSNVSVVKNLPQRHRKTLSVSNVNKYRKYRLRQQKSLKRGDRYYSQ